MRHHRHDQGQRRLSRQSDSRASGRMSMSVSYRSPSSLSRMHCLSNAGHQCRHVHHMNRATIDLDRLRVRSTGAGRLIPRGWTSLALTRQRALESSKASASTSLSPSRTIQRGAFVRPAPRIAARSNTGTSRPRTAHSPSKPGDVRGSGTIGMSTSRPERSASRRAKGTSPATISRNSTSFTALRFGRAARQKSRRRPSAVPPAAAPCPGFLWLHRLPPAILPLRLAEANQGLTSESSAKEQDARGLFLLQKRHRLAQFPPRRGDISHALGQQPQVQVGHRESRLRGRSPSGRARRPRDGPLAAPGRRPSGSARRGASRRGPATAGTPPRRRTGRPCWQGRRPGEAGHRRRPPLPRQTTGCALRASSKRSWRRKSANFVQVLQGWKSLGAMSSAAGRASRSAYGRPDCRANEAMRSAAPAMMSAQRPATVRAGPEERSPVVRETSREPRTLEASARHPSAAGNRMLHACAAGGTPD